MTAGLRSTAALLLACAVAPLAHGCTVARYYRGVPLRSDPAVLVEGQSTKADVLHLFGPPVQITHQTDGDAFVYAYDRENFSSLTLREPISGQMLFTYRRDFDKRDTLVVLFDYAGVVRGVAVDHHTEDLPAL
jgi:outer membrane protein assembly factor BamE (lipoprotein component of BamABCDE complex)